MQNNKLKVCAGVLTVFSLYLSNSSVVATPLDVRFVNQNAFLYGDHIEAGIAADGVFGSQVPSPTGEKEGSKLGYISDPSKNKFIDGYHGDFFMPETSEEGWGIYFDGKTYNNNRNQQWSGINGSIVSTHKTETTATATWESKKPLEGRAGKEQLDGLQITQIFRIYKAGLAAIIDVELKNTTSSLMENIYYMRTVDPDNNAEQSSSSSPYSTTNIILHQGNIDGRSAVVAKQNIMSQASSLVSRIIPSVLSLCGQGDNSRVAHGGTGNINFPYYRHPKEVYDKNQIVDDRKTEDSPIAIAFKFDKIFPGQSVKFRTGYQLADITPATIDIDDSNASGNSFTQVYELGTDAVNITDTDVSISGLENDSLVGASIKLSNALPDDKLAIKGDLPSGISIDTNEQNNDTEIHLTGTVSKADYILALQQVTFENKVVTSRGETRKISIMILDSNYTPGTAATSIIEIVVPVGLNSDSIIEDDIFNESEANKIVLTGTSAPNASIEVVFTDKEGQKIAKTINSDDKGVWTLESDLADISTLADGLMKIEITSTDANNNKSLLTKELLKDTAVVLTISSPKNGEIANSSEPVIQGESDPDAKITLTLLGIDYSAIADDSGHWSITLPKQALGASLTLTVKAIDPAGNEATLEGDNSITIKIPSIPLEVASVGQTTTPIFSGTSTPGTNITVTVPTPSGGTETCSTTTGAEGNWSCQLPSLPSGGPYAAVIKTEDDNDNISSITHPLTVPKLPLIIESPADNSEISDSSPIVSGTSNPDSTITVTASTGEKCIAITDSEGKWICELPVLPLDTAIKLTVVAKDNANNTTTTTIDIKTPKLALEVTGIDISTAPTFTGTSTPDTTITITIPISTTELESCSTTVKADGSWSCKLPILPSDESFTATVKADDGNGNYSEYIQVLSTPNLPLSIDSHADNANISNATPMIVGTSSVGSSITLTASTGETCTTTTDSQGRWQCEMPALPLDKTVILTVKAEDSIGNMTTKTISLTTPKLPLSIDSLADNANISNATPIIVGTSSVGSSITLTASTGETCTTTTDSQGRWQCEMPALPLDKTVILTVKAEDSIGNMTTKTISLTTPKLPLSIDSHADNANISNATPMIVGTSSVGSSITLTASKGETCTTTTDNKGRWQCEMPALPLDKTVMLTVKAEDSIGNTTTAKTISLTTPKLPLSIDSHTDNGNISNATPMIVGTSSVGSSITLTASTGETCTTTTDSQGRWQCEMPALPLDKTVILTVKAEDSIGNTTTKTTSLTTSALPVSINQIELSTAPVITGQSTPETTITVSIPVNGITETCTTTTDSDGNWSCQLPALPTGGPYSITVSAVDDKGNTSSIMQEFSAPELPLIIDSPTNNAVISGITPIVSGTSMPDTAITVTTSTGLNCIATTDSSNHWRCELPSLAQGSHYTLTVVTKDSVGNSTTKIIGISTNKLPLAVISPEDNGISGDSTPNFIGTTTPGIKVTVTAETGQECETIADESGHWACELPEMPVGGPYSVTIKVEDTDGNITTLTASITIPKIPLIITSPTKSEVITETSVMVTGTSDPNAPITVLGPDGERCVTVSDEKGDWSCQLDNLQSGDGKYITVISGNKDEGQKFSLMSIDIKNTSEKVITILKGGAGSFTFFMMLLISFSLLLKQAVRRKKIN